MRITVMDEVDAAQGALIAYERTPRDAVREIVSAIAAGHIAATYFEKARFCRCVATGAGAAASLEPIACATSHLHDSPARYASLQFHNLIHGASMADNSMTGTFQIELPEDLLSEAKRVTRTDELHVEGWRDTWLSRISELVVGKD